MFCINKRSSKNEIVEVKLKEEDYDMVMENLVVYNEIYAQVRSRMKMRPLNEFSDELAVLDARINTRSLMCRALTHTIPPVKRSQHSTQERRVDSGHRVVDC